MSRIAYNTVFTNNFKFNSYTLNFLMPLSEENATCAALLSQLLKRGCEKYGEMHQITATLESLYDAALQLSADKIGENLSFTVQGYFMDNRFAVDDEDIMSCVLDVMSQLLFYPLTENGERFRDNFFEQEKANHADVIRGIINDKRTFALLRCKELMFKDRAYRFSSNGTLSFLETLTNKRLFDFYRNMLATAEVVVTYIGRKTDVEKLTQQYFGRISGIKSITLCKSDPISPVAPQYVAESFEVAQGKLCMGFRFTERVDYYTARLFNVIFGASPTSKLFMNVRERLSLCYYCSSSYDPYVHSLFVSSGIEFENYKVARDEILAQLTDVQNGNVSQEEFENGKKYLLDYIMGIKDSHGALVSDKLHGYLLGNDDSIEEQTAKIEAVTLNDIIAVSQKVRLDTVYFLKGVE